MSTGQAQNSQHTQTQTATEPRAKQPWLWNVVLLDDQEHTVDYVIRMMRDLFRHDPERAFQIAQTVDSQGRAVCVTTHKEHAELKRDQVHAYGKDPLMAVCKGSMSAVIEPAEFPGDDAAGRPDGHGEAPRSEPGA